MIFFDIDETLLDHDQAEKKGAIDFFKEYTDELQLSDTEFVQLWYNLSNKYFEKFLAKELSFQEQRRMRIKDLFGHHLSNEQADSRFNNYLCIYKSNWSAFKDVVPCLKQLKQLGFRLGIISNGDYAQQLEKLKSMGISNYFECIITSSETGVAKPNAAIFLEACNQAKVQVQESYYIGDRLETDAIGSINAGMKGIWINRKNKTTYPDVKVIHSLSELIALVN
ncbi:HAD family hydrolase [Ectobacillus polymachus]|uniref:HAD family hydrolase n=1 Tax=Ectobacillus polymachus TaxID=1508806 RepID=UPI003A8600AC